VRADALQIGLVTCADLSRYFPSARDPLLTHDDQAAADALRARRHGVSPIVWGEPVERVLDRRLDLVIVRSPWDYMDSPDHAARFLAWLEALDAAAVRLENPPPMIRWNLDKRYLADLAAQGVMVVPTRYLPAAAPLDLPTLQQELGELVLKPCVSAAAKDTFRVRTRAEAEELVRGSPDGARPPLSRLRAGRDFMVQPFVSEVIGAGEWSLVFFDGAYSHAVLKRPAPGNWLVQDELGGSVQSAEPPVAVRQAALAALAALADPHLAGGAACAPLLYARVDVIPAAAGPLVSELELIEPELFFLRRSLIAPPRPDEAALTAFVSAVERRALGA